MSAALPSSGFAVWIAIAALSCKVFLTLQSQEAAQAELLRRSTPLRWVVSQLAPLVGKRITGTLDSLGSASCAKG